MTLQQRLKVSAQELVSLLEQSEKEHQEFIKERDAQPGVDDHWEPDGHPIGFNVLLKLPYNAKALSVSLDSKRVREAYQKGIEACGIDSTPVPIDNGKSFTANAEIADRIHSASTKASRLIDSICEKITSEMHAIMELKGLQGLGQDLNSKIVFNVEVFRSGNHIKCKVDNMKETDGLLEGIGDDLVYGILGIE